MCSSSLAHALAAEQGQCVGRRRWPRRGAMVTDRYQHLRHHEDVAALLDWARGCGLPVIGVDNVPGSVPIEGQSLPEACILLFGTESEGLTAPARAGAERLVHISQYGSTRSISGGAVVAIAWHACVRQLAQPQY